MENTIQNCVDKWFNIIDAMSACISFDLHSYPDLLPDVDPSDNRTPIRQIVFDLDFATFADDETVNYFHRLALALQNMTSLEHVTFRNGTGDYNDLFIQAAVQNEAIHTVTLCRVFFSKHIFLSLLKRKRRVAITDCPISGLDFNEEAAGATLKESDTCVCDVQEIAILGFKDLAPMTKAIESVQGVLALTALHRLSVQMTGPLFHDEANDVEAWWASLERILQMAPLLEEVEFREALFSNPFQLQLLATTINNAPSTHLKWSLHDCFIPGETAAVLEEVICRDHAKPLRLCFGPIQDIYPIHKILQKVIKTGSCVTKLSY